MGNNGITIAIKKIACIKCCYVVIVIQTLISTRKNEPICFDIGYRYKNIEI